MHPPVPNRLRGYTPRRYQAKPVWVIVVCGRALWSQRAKFRTAGLDLEEYQRLWRRCSRCRPALSHTAASTALAPTEVHGGGSSARRPPGPASRSCETGSDRPRFSNLRLFGGEELRILRAVRCSAPINITTAAGLTSSSASTTLPVTLCWMRCARNSLTGMSSLGTPWAPPRGPNWALCRWPLSAPIKSARDDQIAVCRGHSVNAERSSTRRTRGSRLAPSTMPSSGRPHSPALSRSPKTSIRATQ